MKESPRILFIGNSITWHPIKEEIGWMHEWGMAASSEEKDYVHVTMDKVKATYPDASYKIAWAVAWEREYWDAIHLVAFKEFLNYKPDIIIIKINENVDINKNKDYPYSRYYSRLIDYLNPNNKSQMIICSGFWNRGILDDEVRLVARERKIPFVELNQLDTDEMKAIGLFDHVGVANHPGDKGMNEMAKLISNKVIDMWSRRNKNGNSKS